MLAVPALLTACSNDNESTPEQSEIRLKSDVWKMMEGTRATIYDNTVLQSSGFVCTAYTAGTITPNTDAGINGTTVTYGSRWQFSDGSHYWPTSGNLDFFAYAPSSGSCITTGPSYSYSSSQQHVSFTCTDLPVTSIGQSSITEFVYALAPGQNKEDHAVSGVTLNFIHPFALIKLQLAENHLDIHINSITFQNVQNNGTYDNGWTPIGATTNLEWTIDKDFKNNTSAKPIGDQFIVIPQGWAGNIVVDADCQFWGEEVNYPSLTTTVPTNWQPGYNYTYTFNISPDDLKVNIERFTEQW